MNVKKWLRIMLSFAVIMLLSLTSAVSSFAGSDEPGYWGNTVHNKHVNSKENITIAEVNESGDVTWENVAYCFNKERGYPVGAYDGSTTANRYEKLELQTDASWKELSENANYDGDMKEILTKIVFVGYPYDSNNGQDEIKKLIKEQCKVDDEYVDDVFRTGTQKAVWHVTDKRPFRVPSSGAIPQGNTSSQVSEYVGKIIYERALAHQGDTGLTTRLWKWPGPNKRNQHLLDTSYDVRNPDGAVAEQTVKIGTSNADGDNVVGSTIQILNDKGDVVHEYTSGSGQEEFKVAPGTYTVREIPGSGTSNGINEFRFTVDENGGITVGESNGNTIVVADGLITVQGTGSNQGAGDPQGNVPSGGSSETNAPSTGKTPNDKTKAATSTNGNNAAVVQTGDRPDIIFSLVAMICALTCIIGSRIYRRD